MRPLLLLGLIACGGTGDNITIVGNPGEMSARIAPASFAVLTEVLQPVDTLRWTHCDGELVEQNDLDLDLLYGQGLRVPAGCVSALTWIPSAPLTLTGSGSPGAAMSLSLDLGTVELPLDPPIEVDGDRFVLEVGHIGWLDGRYLQLDLGPDITVDPSDALAMALADRMSNGHGLFTDSDEDGELSATERDTERLSRPEGPFTAHRLAAVGQGLAALGSKDGGLDWVGSAPGQTTDPEQDVHAVAFGPQGFVAVGGAAQAVFLTSADGLAWTDGQDAGPGLQAVVHGDRYLAVGLAGRRSFSTTGLSWTDATGNDGVTTYRAVAYGGGRYVAVGDGGARSTSADGDVWTDQAGGDDLLAATYGAGTFVAMGVGGRVLTSADGSGWTERTALGTTVRGVTFGSGQFVAVGDGGSWTSADGVAWVATAGDDLTAVTYGAGAFSAVGADGTRYRSLDGSLWSPIDTPASPRLLGVAYGSFSDPAGD
ncbi:MAG: hypothetical protein EP330_11145 [Deltaproteobacteria bacterium]|nr:MAG: hypothetical protein EP330_11145 [Deltaproteobacteria bacterium]